MNTNEAISQLEEVIDYCNGNPHVNPLYISSKLVIVRDWLVSTEAKTKRYFVDKDKND